MSVEMSPGEPWGKCFVAACPLFGSLGRGSEWACFCHFNADTADFNEITNMLLRERVIGESTLELRLHYGTDAWPETFKRIQQRFRDAERLDLLFNAEGKDTPPARADGTQMPPVVRMWMARLETVLVKMAMEIAQKNRSTPVRQRITVPTAPVIGPTHAMQHYTEIQQ